MAGSNPFWLVWREGGGAPTVKRSSGPDAEKGAERLAGQNPGVNFFVLAPTFRVRANHVEREHFDDIPF